MLVDSVDSIYLDILLGGSDNKKKLIVAYS